jgi:hypothetical protein
LLSAGDGAPAASGKRLYEVGVLRGEEHAHSLEREEQSLDDQMHGERWNSRNRCCDALMLLVRDDSQHHMVVGCHRAGPK